MLLGEIFNGTFSNTYGEAIVQTIRYIDPLATGTAAITLCTFYQENGRCLSTSRVVQLVGNVAISHYIVVTTRAII